MREIKRPHVYAMDWVRALTVIGVISVHSTWFTLNGGTSATAGGILALLHYTREVFMALTGFVLTYSLWDRPVKWLAFWKRRYWLVLVPYVFWSAAYLQITHSIAQPMIYFPLLAQDLLTGKAWFHLYYLLVTMQFYLLMPVFLVVMRWAKQRPGLVLSLAALGEIILMQYDHTVGSTGILVHQSGVLVLTYELYFIVGGVTAVHWDRVSQWLHEHSPWVWIGLLVAALIMEGAYLIQLHQTHTVNYADSVMQPWMVPWSILTFFGLITIGLIGEKQSWRLKPLIRRISNLSFGIYLIHPMILAGWLWLLSKVGVPLDSWVLDVATVAAVTSASLLVIGAIARLPISPFVIGRSTIGTRKSQEKDQMTRASTPTPS